MARYSQPSSVQRQVMSEVQTWFGAVGVKFRANKLSATGCVCFESVVPPRFYAR